MSGGFSLWSFKPESKRLIESVKKAHFRHVMQGGYGLTYQSCRFCRMASHQRYDDDHGECTIKERTFEKCRGLWKYGVRHYICGPCRKSVLLGLKPKKQEAGK